MRDQHGWSEGVVVSTRQLTDDVREIVIAPEGGARAWTPGAHIDVLAPLAGGAEPRTYSLVGLWRPGRYRIAVKRAAPSRGGSAFMWTLRPGARVTIAAPNNRFELAADGAHRKALTQHAVLSSLSFLS